MQHPDEGTIHAWIDGELSQDDATALEAHLGDCTECSAKVAEARGLVAASSRIVSALDIVPGGVIPAVPARRRPWYASTQLRAAAAIAIVASASMLVMRDSKEATMDSVLSVTAPAPTTAEADRAVTQSEAPAAGTANAPADAGTDLRKEKSTAPRREKLERQSAVSEPPLPVSPGIASAPAASPPLEQSRAERRLTAPSPALGPMARRAANEASSAKTGNVAGDSAQRLAAPLSDAVVTGVAVATEELKQLRSDSAVGVRRTVYELSPGLEATLTDSGPPARARSQALGASASAPPPPPAVAERRAAFDAVAVNSITWRDKRGHTMTLSGPVSKERLEALRRQLPEDKR